MKKTIILLLILFISGLPRLGTMALAQTADLTKPSIRHLAPTPDSQSETFKIEAFIEGDAKRGGEEVYLWFRLRGAEKFKKIKMQRTEKNAYETTLSQAAQGLEYYIEMLSTDGQQENDGNAKKPYFFKSVITTPPFRLSTAKTETGLKKPFWRKTWFWVAVVTIVGGGIALAGSGGDKGQNTGTVTVN